MKRLTRPSAFALALLCVACIAPGEVAEAIAGQRPSISVNRSQKTILLETSGAGLRINLNQKCWIDSLWIDSKPVVGPGRGGAYSGFRTGPVWHTTRELLGNPRVVSGSDSVRITGIRYSCGETAVDESWTFAFDRGDILWTIDRVLPQTLTLDDNAFPAFWFGAIDDFDAALLGNGGVAWFRLFNDSAIAYGVHTDLLTLWKAGDQRCLRLGTRGGEEPSAVTLSRAGRSLTCAFSRSPSELQYRYDAGTHRRRFVRGSTDVWQPTKYPAGAYRQVLRISSPDFQDALGRGTFRGIDGEAITAMSNTIARLGVIDSRLYGGNSWHTPYGPVCLHEQYIGQFGIAIDDENYVAGYKECLDYYRDHAIKPDGRVKSRWAYTDEDAAPGSADTLGFYEAQWGILLDSNPDFVINVADAFDQCGDLAWLRTHKQSCEKVLGYLLHRDSDGDFLVEMLTDSHREKKGSDWLDVIWASWENAFVNAELYHALIRWSELEEVMGDSAKAHTYRAFAAGLKESFNRSTEQGGFWQDTNHWYVHWREKDGTVYGNNLVTSVNFMAIGYGLCDDAGRRMSVLGAIEKQMQKEALFFWPSCMFPYETGAGHDLNYPFPGYENGDLFLSWGELGIRAYATDFPEIALRYVKNVIDRYRKDGLAFQRYLRASQQGSGDDILAGNASAITGLYRDIYGIQPRYNRLYLNPHLVRDLYGTQLRYYFQGAEYHIELNGILNAIAVAGFKVSSPGDFALKADGPLVLWYSGNSARPAMALSTSGTSAVEITIREWSGRYCWTERNDSRAPAVSHQIMDLPPNQAYAISCDGHFVGTEHSDNNGILRFDYEGFSGSEQLFEILPRR
ncbi:MAG TPA: hypothetical protein VF514_16615 [Bacteroidota bacterium]